MDKEPRMSTSTFTQLLSYGRQIAAWLQPPWHQYTLYSSTLPLAMTLSKFAGCLPEGYGYVVLVGCVGNTFLNMWLAINVGRARKRLDVPYPEMYSSSSKEFNCIQRAHQNTLEVQGQFLAMLFIGGLQYPKISAGAGAVYLIARVVYALGYYSGDPSKRRWGAFGHLAELCLLGNAISFGAHLLKWV